MNNHQKYIITTQHIKTQTHPDSGLPFPVTLVACHFYFKKAETILEVVIFKAGQHHTTIPPAALPHCGAFA